MESLQSSAGPGLQAPATHASPIVQALPSLHVLATGVLMHPLTAEQVSSVHTLASSHVAGCPAQLDPLHLSSAVHAFPSSQVAPLVGK